MQIRITYIFHNCFVVSFNGTALLFDLPAASYLNDEASSALEKAIEGHRLLIFASHAHGDHYSPEIFALRDKADRGGLILSRDIVKKEKDVMTVLEKLGPAQKKDNGITVYGDSTVVAGPEKSFEFDGLLIETLKSNDRGVAFLVEVPCPEGSLKIYHGGDLARWDWKDNDAEDMRLILDCWEKALERNRKWRPDIAFSNCDRRLESYAGGREFLMKVEPHLFVPMHSFGDTSYIVEFAGNWCGEKTGIFGYRRSGDSIQLDFSEILKKRKVI